LDPSIIFEAVTAVTVVLGILLGLLQLRHYHLSRKRETALLLLNAFQTRDFSYGIWLIQGLPRGLTKREIEDRLGDGIRSVSHVMCAWESIGVLVFNHELSIDIVDDAYGGAIMLSWERLEKCVTDLRDELDRETPFEWFQWLADRMIEREKAGPPVPAHRAYTDWKP
jgi:hypothetical protein